MASSTESTAWTTVNGTNSSSRRRRWSVGQVRGHGRGHEEAGVQAVLRDALAADQQAAVAARLGDGLL